MAKIRRNFFLSPEKNDEKFINDFLEKCPRDTSIICVLAISEMIKKYHLENASPEMIKNFISYHHFVENFGMPYMPETAGITSREEKEKKEASIVKVTPADEIKKTYDDLINDDDKNQMKDIMAGW